MFPSKLKFVAAALLVVGLLGGGGAAYFVQQALAEKPAKPAEAAPAEKPAKPADAAAGEKKPQVIGVHGVVMKVVEGMITIRAPKPGTKETEEKSFALAKDVPVVLNDQLTKEKVPPVKEGKLGDLSEGTPVTLQLTDDGKSVTKIIATGTDLRAMIKSVDAAKRTIIVVIKDKEKGQTSELTLQVAAEAKVLRNDGIKKGDPDQEAKLDDLKEGIAVQIRLTVDRKTALSIRMQGPSVNGTLKAYDAGNRSLTVTVKEDGGPVDKTFTVAQDAQLVDLADGQGVSVRLSVFDGKTVVAAVGQKASK